MIDKAIVQTQHVPISEESYVNLPQGVRDWIEQELQWKKENIVSFHIKYEIAEDGEIKVDGHTWKKWKYGNGRDVIVKNGKETKYQDFVCENGEWKKKEG
jgi:hypothetical protein